MRSKAHWGYDETFMALCYPVLRVRASEIETGLWRVAVDDRGRLLGVVALKPTEEPGTFDLRAIFVEPDAMGRGVGQALFCAAEDMLRSVKGTTLTILSDPGACAFYQRMGAVIVGEAPSDAISGRTLPVLHFTPSS
ncbi:MAG: GNAT family N-acetyltransferase [Geminicoccaceae bacterium]